LDANQERDALLEIRELEIERWRAVLGCCEAVENITRTLTCDIRTSSGGQRTHGDARRALTVLRRTAGKALAGELPRCRFDAQLNRAARAMYRVDIDRGLINAVHDRISRPVVGSVEYNSSHISRVLTTARHAEAARHRFIRSNLLLVMTVAGRYWKGQLPFNDLFQEGTMGCIKALNRMDVDREVRFSTYAVWWIRNFIARAIVDKAPIIRFPGHLNTALKRVRAAEERLSTTLGRVPDDSEITRVSGVSARVLELIRRRAVSSVTSIDADPSQGSGIFRGHQLADESRYTPYEAALVQTFSRKIDGLLESLSPMERAIIIARYGLSDRGEGATLREIGESFDLSRERIRQILRDALVKLRNRLTASA